MKDLYKIFKQSQGISIDTRTIKGGELFFCLKGERFNGNKYAQKALELKACYVVIDDPEYYVDNGKMLLVDDSLKTLQELSYYHRSQLSCDIIGITGTNGKTTTKELITQVLSSHLRCVSTIGNLNNHIGVPLSLLRITNDTDVAVIEMGANHPGEIKDLCELVSPSYGIITNIGKAHLEGFGTYETIIDTKMALYKKIEENAGHLFINTDDTLLMDKAPEVSLITYGQRNKVDVNVDLLESEGALAFVWKSYHIRTQLFGDYNLYNVAAAIAVGMTFGVPEEKMTAALEEYTPSNNRSQFLKGDHNSLILDAYNANPESMRQAITFFEKSDIKQKTMILGDMFELGTYQKEEHQKVLDYINDSAIKNIFLVGNAFFQFKEEYPQFKYFFDSEQLRDYLKINPIKDQQILLKGSRGIGLEVLKDILL